MDQVGILYDNRQRNLPLQDAVRMAQIEFGHASHTRDYKPKLVEVHPDTLIVNGLPIVFNEELTPGLIRVCTGNIDPADEFQADKAAVARLVSAAAA